MKNKPILKPIGSVAGIGGRNEVRQYLIQQFAKVGLHPYDNGLPGLVHFKGIINHQEITIAFSILKLTKYKGLHQDHQVKYRTFQGIRAQFILPTKQKTRLIIAKKTQGKWLKKITSWAMKLKKFKFIDNHYFGKEVYSRDKLFASQFINDEQIKSSLNQLNQNNSCISWGMILIPEQLNINITYQNLDDFESKKLHNLLLNLIKLNNAVEKKQISQELAMSSTEVLARDNPKKSLKRGMWIALLYLLFIFLLVGSLVLIAVKLGS